MFINPVARSPFLGVWNILRFNWHFYVLTLLSIISLFGISFFLEESWKPTIWLLVLLICLPLCISLIVSFYIYDCTNLYQLPWLPDLNEKRVLYVHAGFDEISKQLRNQYPKMEFHICDFFDPNMCDEISIKRARKIYPIDPKTIQIHAEKLPFAPNSFDICVVFFAAHELRKQEIRTKFLSELARVCKKDGFIYVTEHLRDWRNTLAYSIGVGHFYSRNTWLQQFRKSKLILKQEVKTTPFVTTFILCPHD
ncbi:methyltransferase domain-containing protein [Sphingobacterium corticis]|uniref:Methyltransferase domain-containing protein n=1 Tax=Sphingobacterium corticis TaxID=1812823 RepID=A0ABW5NLT5_9SPHI